MVEGAWGVTWAGPAVAHVTSAHIPWRPGIGTPPGVHRKEQAKAESAAAWSATGSPYF